MERSLLTHSRRVVPLDAVGIACIVAANVITWVPLIVMEHPQRHQEDPFFICGLLACALATTGTVLNFVWLIQTVRKKLPKARPSIGILCGVLTTLAIAASLLFRVAQTASLHF